MKELVERMLGRVFAQKAHDPDFDHMTGYERREAAAVAASPKGMQSPLASSPSAEADAREAMAPRHMPMESPLVDDSAAAAEQAESASIPDGSHLQSEPVSDNMDALDEVAEANHHEAPRSELVDGSDEARYAAMRASERSTQMGSDEEEERAEKRAK